MIENIIVTKLDQIEVDGGNVMHAMKSTDPGFINFGEAYFSKIGYNKIKAWKRHKKMTLNLVVPYGKIEFVFIENIKEHPHRILTITLGQDNYQRITVPPYIWMGFKGLDKDSFLLNISDIPHDPNEVERLELEEINYSWNT